ncbi:c-type cytochrome [Oceanospirillum beijerinckii]|uniref:c-type cytochrome n=1 Tax=Oceanospirillum beijerinckii TaxID=64976 RepID=UPI000422BED5|nr:cytochrome c [Oceanospirillum beijerinckii]
MKRHIIFSLLLAIGLITACSEPSATDEQHKQSSAVSTGLQVSEAERWYSAAMVEQGKVIFQQNCAQCHGGFAQGNPDWRQPKADGRYLPPPLNGSGHAWHHPLDQLRQVIKYGQGPDIPSDMPAWDDKLSDQEIDATIAWFQSRWPEPIYQAWNRPKH